MAKSRTLGQLPRLAGIVFGVLVLTSPARADNADGFAEMEKANAPLMMLAAKLASPADGASKEWKDGLVSSYEAVYGKINLLPSSWPALVRRALTCHAIGDPTCVQTSLAAIEASQGGIGKLPLGRLVEVSRFGLKPDTIAARLRDAENQSEPKKADVDRAGDKPAPVAEKPVDTIPVKEEVPQTSVTTTVAEPAKQEAPALASAQPAPASEAAKPPVPTTMPQASSTPSSMTIFLFILAAALAGAAAIFYKRSQHAKALEAEVDSVRAEQERLAEEKELATSALKQSQELQEAELQRVQAERDAEIDRIRAEQEALRTLQAEELARAEAARQEEITRLAAEQEALRAKQEEELAKAHAAFNEAKQAAEERLRAVEEARKAEADRLAMELKLLEEQRKAERERADAALRQATEDRATLEAAVALATEDAKRARELANELKATGDATAAAAEERATELQHALDMAEAILKQKEAEAAEAKRIADELKAAEEARKAEEERVAAEAARRAEEDRRAEEERLAAERRQREEDEQREAELRAEEARRPVDPVQAATRRMLYSLQEAQMDVEPFLELLGSTAQSNAMAPKIAVLRSWRDAIWKTGENVTGLMERRGWDYDVVVRKQATSLGEALERLMNHAAFFTALLHVQNKRDSAVYHWSQQLPAALIQLFWSHQTNAFAMDVKSLPMPDVSMDKAPVTIKDSAEKPQDFFANAVRKAARTESTNA